MKLRIEGRRNGNAYQIIGVDGSVMSSIPLDEARNDRKLAAAIKRNGWEAIDG